MLTKANYMKFLFFFIIYLGVNLLISKIRSSDHERDLKISRNRVVLTETHKIQVDNVVLNLESTVKDASQEEEFNVFSINTIVRLNFVKRALLN